MLVVYWLCLLHMGAQDIAEMCREWQVNNLRIEVGAVNLKEYIQKLGSLYGCQFQAENNTNGVVEQVRQDVTIV